MKKVIVIGGGAAGMAAAYAASFHVADVLLLERNEKLGKKIYITGQGRGNLTNAADIGDFFEHIVSNPKFLYSALYGFTNEQLLELLKSYGLVTKTERAKRVFPASDHASDITAAWRKALQARGVKVRLNCGVKELLTKDVLALPEEAGGGATFCITGVRLDDGSEELADHVIVATGGISYPSTGSTGDGLRFAQGLRIHTTVLRPALVPFTTLETDICALQGLSLKNVGFLVFDGKKRLYEGFGEMLFTHFGVSGPLVLSASSRVTGCFDGAPSETDTKDDDKHPAQKKTLSAEIDFKPRLSKEQVDKRLLAEIQKRPKQAYRRFFEGLLPKGIHPVMVARSGIDKERRIGTLTKEDRQIVGGLLKHFSLTLTGTRGFKEAIITQGGVDVKEIDPQTMRAKRIKGLSFAGEVIDVDALTGGFNLQIAFSTGIAAGNGLAES